MSTPESGRIAQPQTTEIRWDGPTENVLRERETTQKRGACSHPQDINPLWGGSIHHNTLGLEPVELEGGQSPTPPHVSPKGLRQEENKTQAS